jgi:hypothetical protein
MYILFYSSFCAPSMKFISLLEKTGQVIYFNKICVDTDKQGQRPFVLQKFQVRKVPSIIVDDVYYEGVNAFKWLRVKMKETRHTGIATRDTKKTKVDVQPVTEEQNEGVYEFKTKKRLVDQAKTIGDDTTVIPVTEMDIRTSKTRESRDKLKQKQSESLFEKLQKEREDFEASLKKKRPNNIF